MPEALAESFTRERLENWKEIAHYLRRSVRRVQRWEAEAGLPVHRLNHDQRSSVYAYTDELEKWRASRAPLEKGQDEEGRATGAPQGARLWWVVLALVGIGAIGVAAGLWRQKMWRPRSTSQGRVWQTKPLTSLPGGEYAPAISPDGKSVLFTYHYQGSGFLYRLAVGGGEPVRVTRAVKNLQEFDAAWSPDGTWIGFLRRVTADESILVAIPAAGGAERELGPVQGISASSNMKVPNRGVGWMANSRELIVSSSDGAGQPNRLWRVDLASGNRVALTNPPLLVLGDANPAVSADGRRLAFHRAMAFGVLEIFTAGLTADGRLAGEPAPLTKLGTFTSSPLWVSADELIYYGYRNGMMRILRQSLRGDGEKEVGPAATEGILPTYSPASQRLVYQSGGNNDDLFRTDQAHGVGGSPIPYLSSTRQEAAPAVSPDGKQVAFTSARSGWPEIWVCQADQSGCHQVSHMNGSITGFSSWSPDSRTVAFNSNGPTKGSIYVVRADGSGLREVAADPAEDTSPCWSADGAWIYFSSKRGGHYQIWRVPAGDGRAEVVTKHGYHPVASGDGHWLFYARDYDSLTRLLRFDLASRREYDDIGEMRLFNLAAGRRGVFFVGQNWQKVLYWQPGQTAAVQKYHLPRGVALGIGVAPDDSYLIYTGSSPTERDLVQIDGLQ